MKKDNNNNTEISINNTELPIDTGKDTKPHINIYLVQMIFTYLHIPDMIKVLLLNQETLKSINEDNKPINILLSAAKINEAELQEICNRNLNDSKYNDEDKLYHDLMVLATKIGYKYNEASFLTQSFQKKPAETLLYNISLDYSIDKLEEENQQECKYCSIIANLLFVADKYEIKDIFSTDNYLNSWKAKEFTPNNIIPEDNQKLTELMLNDSQKLSELNDTFKKEVFANLANLYRKKFALEAIKKNEFAFMQASDDLRNDKDVILATVKQNASALEFASDDLKEDKNFMLQVVEKNASALAFASDDLKKDKNFMLQVVEKNGLALEFVPTDLENYTEIVLAAIGQNGLALEFVPTDLKKNISKILINNMEYINRQEGRDKYTCFSKICNNIYYFSDFKNKGRMKITQKEENLGLDTEALEYIIEDAQLLPSGQYAKLTDEKLEKFLMNVDNIIESSKDKKLIDSFKALEIKNDKDESVTINDFIEPRNTISCSLYNNICSYLTNINII